jgi:hypothetical protein
VSKNLTPLESFSELVSSGTETKELVKFFSDIALSHGDWIASWIELKSLPSAGPASWADLRKFLQEDIARHGYDFGQWRIESVTAIALMTLSCMSLAKLMRTVTLACAEAHAAENSLRDIGEIIAHIVYGEQHEKK